MKIQGQGQGTLLGLGMQQAIKATMMEIGETSYLFFTANQPNRSNRFKLPFAHGENRFFKPKSVGNRFFSE